jgi:hypothetical protein
MINDDGVSHCIKVCYHYQICEAKEWGQTMLMKKLMLLSLLVKNQTVQQSTHSLSLIQAVSPSHAHSYILCVKCHVKGSTTQPRCYSCSFRMHAIPKVHNISLSLNFITWIKNKNLVLKLELIYKSKALTLKDEHTLTTFVNGYWGEYIRPKGMRKQEVGKTDIK